MADSPSPDTDPRPDSKVLHRHAHSRLPFAVAGEGPYVIDQEGKRYLDACGGAAVSCLGHSDQDVISAIQRQSAQMPFAHTAFFTNEPMEALADAMVAGAPDGLDRVYFTSGGSEAVEAALKMARQYFVEIGEPDRLVFIARRQSYHGNTHCALAAGGNEWCRAPFRDIMAESRHVSPCYAYREKLEGESGEPGADVVTDDDMIEYLRNFGNTGFHPTSTCRMGVDETAVVDPRLRLHGFEGLRVVDASVMPSITSGNTNAPTIMIAEKVADMIREVARIC